MDNTGTHITLVLTEEKMLLLNYSTMPFNINIHQYYLVSILKMGTHICDIYPH